MLSAQERPAFLQQHPLPSAWARGFPGEPTLGSAMSVVLAGCPVLFLLKGCLHMHSYLTPALLPPILPFMHLFPALPATLAWECHFQQRSIPN